MLLNPVLLGAFNSAGFWPLGATEKKKILSLDFPALPKILAPPPSGFRFPDHPPGPFRCPPLPVSHINSWISKVEEGGVTFLGQLLLGQVAEDRLRPRIYPVSS